MAILRGFPPSNTISPSVRITEKDLSFIAAEDSFHRAGLVGFASKGPINIPTTVRTSRELHTVFGWPHPEVGDPYMIYAAEQYLLIANELWLVRVAETDLVNDEAAQIAEIAVPISGTAVIIQSEDLGPYTFTTPGFFRWKVNGILSSKTLVVAAAATVASPVTLTVTEIVEDLNDQLDDVDADLDMNFDGIVFVEATTGELQIQSTFSFGPNASIEMVSVLNSIYGGAAAITGLGTGMTQATTTGTNQRYPSDSATPLGTYDLTGLTDVTLQVVVDGTDNVLIDNTIQIIDLENLEGQSNLIADVVIEINDYIDNNLPGGFQAVAIGNNLAFRTDHFGRDAKVLVKTVASYAIFGFSGVTAIGVSPESTTGVANDHAGIVTGAAATGTCFTLMADSAGIEGNNTQVVITNDDSSNTFVLEVYSSDVQVESWGSLTKNQSSRYYVETFLALVSDFIRVDDNTATAASPADSATGSAYALVGGSDGIPADPDDQDDLIIGNEIGFTGMFALSEPEQIDIDLIAVPGHSSTAVIVAMLFICQSLRMDCLAIVDPPFGLTVNEIIQWQNGTHPLNSTRFDSDFGALYWPWVKISDSFNGVDVWVPPSGSVMAVYARSDNFAAPWFAPAGTTRGVVPGITDVFSRPTLEERDSMYGNRNAINPIVQFSDAEGFLVWGQKTLQRTPTALDRVNVRRLMFVVEKRIRQASRRLLFDPHDDEFPQQFARIADTILREIQVGRGINAYIIKADEELNTPDVIDRNEFRARIGIQPLRAVEFIFIEFSIHRTGSFEEGVDNF